MMLLLEDKKIGQQSATKFNPTAEQLVFADFYIQCKGNVHAASFAYGNPSRSVYYSWKKQVGFDEWLSEYAKQEVLKHRGRWYLLLEKYAEKGSFQHLDRLLQIAKEFCPEHKIILGGEIDVNYAAKFDEHANSLLRRFNPTLP